MRTVSQFLLVALLLGCGSEPEPVAAPANQPVAAESRGEAVEGLPVPVESLAGEWRVAGIDGEEVNAPYGITLSINDETIDLLDCADLKWTYSYTDGQIETAHLPFRSTEILCRPPPEVQAAGEAIDAATRVARTPSNGVELSGGGHSLTLYAQ
jgi:hypothetical protein